jgi:L-ascorbate metabolism protein UlaG (beta-lactamase superfamily)
MKITYFGHSCFELNIKDKKILFDPFISPNELAKNIDITKIKPNYILISHGHKDHIADAVQIAKQSNATVICNWETHVWLNKQGVESTHPMNIGGKKAFDFGNVKCVTAVHSSSLPDGTYGGNAMGFIIESTEINLYYAGDTALTYDMKLIGEYRSIQLAFLPIGDNFTMGIDNAIIASDFIKCKKIIGMHYDTFGYIKIDKEQAKQKFRNNGLDLKLFEIGETSPF